jgi:hypothetical protein
MRGVLIKTVLHKFLLSNCLSEVERVQNKKGGPFPGHLFIYKYFN